MAETVELLCKPKCLEQNLVSNARPTTHAHEGCTFKMHRWTIESGCHSMLALRPPESQECGCQSTRHDQLGFMVR
jgi:hypothetical protein